MSAGVAAIVVAAGLGERAADGAHPIPKQYRPLAGIPVLSRTVSALLAHGSIARVQVVINPAHAQRYADLRLSDPRLLPVAIGGARRQDSVRLGLDALADDPPELVLIQDAARPFIGAELIENVLEGLRRHEAVLPCLPVTDTIKRSDDGVTVVATEDRRSLFAAQTPQGFRYSAIRDAHQRAAEQPLEFTDDAAIAEWAGLTVAIAPGSPHNIKLTRSEDFGRAERLLMGDAAMETRIGAGFDVHPFTDGDAVTLGGVRIRHDRGLLGHSDADAALHALADSIYGALGEGDIGTHFPPSDPQWRGAPSRMFLAHAAGLVRGRGGRVVNLDLTIVCEAPRIAPHVPAMREAIAAACGIEPSRVGVKATTSERLGFTGRQEGIVALASASIELPR